MRSIIVGILAMLSLATTPILAWSSCQRSRVVAVRRAVVVQAAAIVVPVAVAVPTYSVSYNAQQVGETDIAAAIRDLARAVEAIGGRPAAGGNGAATGLTYQAVMTARCAQCHQDGKAEASGMILIERDGKPSVLSLAEKRRILQLVEAGDMPPKKSGVVLAEGEKSAIRDHLLRRVE